MLVVKGIFLVIFVIQSSHCHSDGAGVESCTNMLPVHGAISQPLPAPFTVNPSVTSVGQGHTVTVTIARTNTVAVLRGFMIQARNAANVPVGQFFPTTGMRAVVCGGFPIGSVATHSHAGARDSMIVVWTAPAGFLGGVVFHVTALQDFSTFWTGLVSPTVTVTA